MNGKTIASAFMLVLLLEMSSHSQSRVAPIINLSPTEFDVFPKRSDDVSPYDYWVDFKKLRLIETYFTDMKKRDLEFRKRLKDLESCSKPTRLLYKDKVVGSSQLCSDGDFRVLLYTYGEKIYEVVAADDETITKFTKEVLPLACQLHGNKACVSMFF